MKTHPHLTLLLAAAVAFIGLSGCASMDAPDQEALLSAAGFRPLTPQTARQKDLFTAAPAYKVQRGTTQDGKTFYAYKDEKKGVAYVGGEAEYQRYQQLAIQKSISRDYYDAALMNQQAAWNWYGAWGPRYFRW